MGGGGGGGGGGCLSFLVLFLTSLKPEAAKKENLRGACAYSGGGAAKGDGPTTKQTQFFFSC